MLFLSLGFPALAGGAAPSNPVNEAASSADVTGAALDSAAKRTTLTLDFSSGVTAEVVTLASPYRVVIDLPRMTFRLPDGVGAKGKGLVKAFRYGLLSEQKSRVVLDLTGPARVEKAAMTPAENGPGVRFALSLVPTDAKKFGAGTGAKRGQPRAPVASEPADEIRGKNRAKPVLVIDPGHGGIDPGASGASNLLEKNMVLAVGRELGAVLAASGRYDVHFTRSTDVFVALSERIAISRQLGADLFISLHADALESKDAAQTVRGASIYTLSEKASDEKARLQAERENASDLLAGVEASDTEERDEVMSILFDLMKRETSEFSSDFASTLVGKLGKTVTLSHDPRKSAAFTVLKQTHAPSVLIELGYISHPEDEKLMITPEWQERVAKSIMAAVDAYFAKRMAGAR